jgi:hypothetical protein|tara:strand:+ start:130 stop:417 length:288 start_codon:yes stop_codon:yes gene_type:complete
MKEIKIQAHEVKSQSDAILWHLKKYGSITSYEAIKEYGATRLSAIIFNHRKDGYNIDSMPLTKKTRFGRNTTISKYVYKKPINLNNQLGMFCEVN